MQFIFSLAYLKNLLKKFRWNSAIIPQGHLLNSLQLCAKKSGVRLERDDDEDGKDCCYEVFHLFSNQHDFAFGLDILFLFYSFLFRLLFRTIISYSGWHWRNAQIFDKKDGESWIRRFRIGKIHISILFLSLFVVLLNFWISLNSNARTIKAIFVIYCDWWLANEL